MLFQVKEKRNRIKTFQLLKQTTTYVFQTILNDWVLFSMMNKNSLVKLPPQFNWILKSVLCTRVTMHFGKGHQEKRKSCTKGKTLSKKDLGWGSTASRLEPRQAGSLLFTTKFPENPGTHFIELWRVKGWIDLGAIHRFWTQDPWIWDPAP